MFKFMNKQQSTNVKKSSKFFVVNLIAIVIICLAIFVYYNITSSSVHIVTILTLKTDKQPFDLVTKDDLTTMKIVQADYKQGMILASQAKNVVGKYTKYYIRAGSFLYPDMFTNTKPVRNAWLYSLEDGKEALSVSISDLNDQLGNILVPGDKVNVRAVYTIRNGANQQIVVDKLFENMTIKDILNNSGESIYEIYSELAKMNESDRIKQLSDQSFRQRLTPKSIVFEADDVTINKFAQVSVMNPKYIVTILSRAGNHDLAIEQMKVINDQIRAIVLSKSENTQTRTQTNNTTK